MARERLIVPLFIPHEGCPYRCVFCNQNKITGRREQADRDLVEGTLSAYLATAPGGSGPRHREAAFYGGTFMGLPRSRQQYLLSLVQPWIDSGRLGGIRLSTHPLSVDSEKLAFLKPYRVRTIELGIQSTDPEVLRLAGRAGSLATLGRVTGWIRDSGFDLGLQLMPGLPGDGPATFLKSVDDTLSLKPAFVRLYPTLVIRHTPLHRLYRQKRFVPWSLEQTVETLKTAVQRFNRAGVPVIRLGLPPDPSLLKNLVAGPHHPCLRYLVDSRICLQQMTERLNRLGRGPRSVVFRVPSKYISNYTGHQRENIRKLKSLFPLDHVGLQGEEQLRGLELVV